MILKIQRTKMSSVSLREKGQDFPTLSSIGNLWTLTVLPLQPAEVAVVGVPQHPARVHFLKYGIG